MRLFRNRGLVFKQSILILCGMVLLLGGIFGILSMRTGQLMSGWIGLAATDAVRNAAHQLGRTFLVAEQAAEDLAGTLEIMTLSDAEERALLERTLLNLRKNCPACYGGSITYAPESDGRNPFPTDMKYACFADGKLQYSMLGGSAYPYWEMDWFLKARESGALIWSEPYFDRGGGNVYMTTCSRPFFRLREGRREFAGVVTLDLALRDLPEVVDRTRIYDLGYAFLVSGAGRFISHPKRDEVVHGSLFSVADRIGSEELRRIAREMIAGREGHGSYAHDPVYGGEVQIYYAPIHSTGWSIGMVFSREQLFAARRKMEYVLAGAAASGIVLLLLLVVAVSGRMIHPLRVLNQAAGEIGQGNFRGQLPKCRSRDEVGALTASFERMQRQLILYTDELQRTAAARQRLESELAIAREIQQGMLPVFSPEFTAGGAFRVAAVLLPAREVGGDLYDCFLLDERHLGMMVGDVSGKGIPAALFMSVAQTLQRDEAARSRTPGECLTRLNARLMTRNESMMFVTCFLAVIDLVTGEVAYANAGHNPPYRLPAGGGAPEPLTELHGPPLALMAEQYDFSLMQLAPGDGLLLYTDGVTEAMNANHEEYGTARLESVLSRTGMAEEPQQTVDRIRSDVEAFVAGAEQSDDLTIFCFRLTGF